MPQKQKAPELHEAMQDCPAPEENFPNWLRYQKSNWRNIRRQTKQGKSVQESVTAQNGRRAATLGSFMHSLDSAVLQYTWHVVQIQKTQEAGILRVWAITSTGQMFSVKLRVDRTIYINAKI